MTLRRETLTVTTDASGAGTVSTAAPINGYVIAVRNTGTWGTIAAGTVDYAFTTAAGEGAGTVLAVANQTEPFTAYAGGSIQGMSSGQAFLGVPVDGYLTMTVAQAAASTAGTVHVYVDNAR